MFKGTQYARDLLNSTQNAIILSNSTLYIRVLFNHTQYAGCLTANKTQQSCPTLPLHLAFEMYDVFIVFFPWNSVYD